MAIRPKNDKLHYLPKMLLQIQLHTHIQVGPG